MVVSQAGLENLRLMREYIVSMADALRLLCQRAVSGGRAVQPARELTTVELDLALAAEFPTTVDEAAPPSKDGEVTLTPPPAPPLTTDERRARIAAIRALLFARQRRYDEAKAAFIEAASLDATLDLATVPTYWNLTRGGQEAAVRAYEELGRTRDAFALAGQIRHTFRPRAIRLPTPIGELPLGRA